MRVISKQISLEPMTSRLPGVVPAYKDGKLYLFDDKSLSAREYVYPSNYGMIPATLGFAVAPSATTNPSLSSSCTFKLSWEEFSKWYFFFRNYYHLLNDWGHCHVKYDSAVEYYEHESKNGYANQMIYGTDRATYEEIDDTFASYGGEPFYKYICEYIVPSVDIPISYVDYWHVNKLYYPDAIKWKHWFDERYTKYGNKTKVGECSGETDCCDCTEYVNRGGKEMRDLLDDFYTYVQSRIDEVQRTMTDNGKLKDCFKPSMILPTSLHVSIDDLGEMSIFCEEYNLGTDYRVANYGDTDNTIGGTVAVKDGNSLLLKNSAGAGFDFDPVYMEKFFNEDQWKEYKGDKFIDDEGYTCTPVNNEEECTDNGYYPEEDKYVRYYQKPSTNTGYYSYDSDNKKVSYAYEYQVRDALAKEYPVTTISAVLINGTLYNIQEEEYGTYKGKKYPVYRELKTDTPYTIIKGKIIYAEFYQYNGNSECYYFPMFLKDNATAGSGGPCSRSDFNPSVYKWYPRVRTEADFSFITYAGTIYEANSIGTVTIGSTSYDKISGIFNNDKGTFYIMDDAVYWMNDFTWELAPYSYDTSRNVAKEHENSDVVVYREGYVEGQSSSKLYKLRSENLLVDDIGNEIPGRYNVGDNYNHQPPEGAELDTLYEVGNVSDVSDFSGLTTYDKSATVNYFYGNILYSMKFYFKDSHGSKYPIDPITATTSLAAIQTLNSDRDDYVQEANRHSATLYEDVYCDVVYYLGATLKRTNGSNEYKLAGGDYSKGVEYKETVRFVKTEYQYYLKQWNKEQIPKNKDSVDAHSLSYPVVCYKLTQDLSDIESEFGNTYKYPLADFSMELPGYEGYKGYGKGIQLYPVFRQEYTIGNSMMQNIDADIYIDRGINAAFEKHIKLGEVTSLEALEQYTNGYFKMMEN